MIDVEPRDLGKVVQLVAKSDGWIRQDTRFEIKSSVLVTGDPGTINQTPHELVVSLRAAWLKTDKERRPLGDHNGPKVALTRLAVTDGLLRTEAELTDYFTLWGLPKADASRAIFEEHERQVVINRVAGTGNALYETDIPWGICTHNMLIDRNGDLLMMIRSQGQGFNQGRVSVTEEEQMEPGDRSAFVTAYRSYIEELGLIVPTVRTYLLGVAMEKGAAYPAFAFIGQTDMLAKDVVSTWRNAKDYKENTALFAVPMTQVNGWMVDEIGADVWQANFLAGDIAPEAKLNLHATSAWRLDLAKKFTQAA